MEWRPMRNAFVAGYYCVTLSTVRADRHNIDESPIGRLPSNGKKY